LIDKAIKNSEQYRVAYSSQDRAKVYNRLKYDPKFVDSVKISEATIQTGFVAIDPTNGEIRALVGGQNQNFGRGLNHVTGIRRQPGSSFKPITYAAAIDNGYSPVYTLTVV
jgi:penicillin-binding protein 1A